MVDQLVSALKDFVQKTGKTRAVFGLSGGVDSALTAAIAAKALGPKNVTALILPNEGLTMPASMADAEAWAKTLGIAYFTVPINPFLKPFEGVLWPSGALAGMNLNARVRAVLLYHYANSHDALVLGTGNKTELALGYFTKYGDGACDVEVIGSLYKTEVWAAAQEAGVPEVIVKKIPSAELFPGQTDEGEMGLSYPEADAILRQMERGEKPAGAAADRVRELMQNARHKGAVPPSLPI